MHCKNGKMSIVFQKSTQIDEQSVSRLALELKVSRPFAEVLISRGLDTKEKADAFLHPDVEQMRDPFSIGGMQSAVDRLSLAVSRDESVVIFGDYDCDGICSISILKLFLGGRLSKLNFFIPDRNSDGYGMSIDTLKTVLEKFSPSLIVTVDTGITAVNEIEYLKSVGVDVIVTDHHEPQELPDCVVVNPKVERNGFSEYAGAGVALKLVEAMSNRETALKYIDIAAVATIADIVPLIGENRIIAYYGLRAVNKKMRRGLQLLMNVASGITAYDVAFKMAPRINAAGRIDNATKAVELFVSDDHFLLEGLAAELNRDNTERQSRCEKTTAAAMDKLRSMQVSALSAVVLADENWETGILGISAAKLAEQFHRPAILFSEKDGICKGSARSVPSVNLFEALQSCCDLFTSFGGHSQAAGVTLPAENFSEFVRRFNEYLQSEYGDELVMPEIKYDMLLDKSMQTLDFVRELEMLEPTGYGNPKPRFLLQSNGLQFERISLTNHIKYRKGDFEIIGYNRLSSLETLKCRTCCEVSVARNIFRNFDYVQATIRHVHIGDLRDVPRENFLRLNLAQLSFDNSEPYPTADSVDFGDYDSSRFGTVFVAFSKTVYDEFLSEHANLVEVQSVAIAESSNPLNRLMLCPQNIDFADYYDNVVLLEKPLCSGWLRALLNRTRARVAMTDNDRYFQDFRGLDESRLRDVYSAIRTILRSGKNSTYGKLFEQLNGIMPVSRLHFDIALCIFAELGLARVGSTVELVASLRVSLADSKIFSLVSLI